VGRSRVLLSVLILAGIALLGGISFLRRRLPPEGSERTSALSTPGAILPGTSKPASEAASGQPARSRAQLVAAARKRIQDAKARWAPWWINQRRLGPPLPKIPEFWSLVESLKRDLGPDAAAVLSDLIDEAAAPRTEQLYIALLAGLKDPAAEPRLASIASALEKSLDSRYAKGLAVYGLGLLKTESAWKVALAAFEKDDSNGRSIFYSGLGLFGERALPFLLKEAESAKFQGNNWAAMMWIQGPGVRDRLWEIVESTKDNDLRGGALQALTREPDSGSVARLFDLLDHPDRPSGVRVDVKGRLNSLFAAEGYSLEGEPRLLAQLLARWESLAPDVRWALLCDPAVRRAKPDELSAAAPPADFKYTYLHALANDPARHGQMADYVRSHLDRGSLMWSFNVLGEKNGFTDPSLAALARAEALRLPEGKDGDQGWAWRVLSLGPSDARSEALAELSRVYDLLPREADRLRVTTEMACAGPDAGPAALNLLRKESNPTIRLDLILTALSTPGREAEVRAIAAGDVDQILSGATDAGIRYAAAYPGSAWEGLNRYAELVRQVFSAYGTAADIPRIRKYFDALLVPDALRSGKNGLEDDECREWLQAGILESIDAIRAKE